MGRIATVSQGPPFRQDRPPLNHRSERKASLILSLASGRPFVSLAPWRKPRRVVLLDFESRLRRLRDDTNKMLQSFSTEERALVDENFNLICEQLVNDEPLDLNRRSESLGIPLPFCDTIRPQ